MGKITRRVDGEGSTKEEAERNFQDKVDGYKWSLKNVKVTGKRVTKNGNVFNVTADLEGEVKED